MGHYEQCHNVLLIHFNRLNLHNNIIKLFLSFTQVAPQVV